MSKTTGDVLAYRVIAGSATSAEVRRVAELYLEMASAFKIEMCLPKDFELQAKYKALEKQMKQERKWKRKLRKQRNRLWRHCSERVDFYDDEDKTAKLADKLTKELG